MNVRTTALGSMLGVAALLVGACDVSVVIDADAVRGSGNVITEDRDVSGFDEIVVFGSGEIVVSVTGTESLMIEAEDNIMPLLTSDVRGGRLELGSEESISPTKTVRYTITMADLTRVEINGSGDVTATGVDSRSVDVEINGSGSVDVAGVSDRLDVAINGSGDFDGPELIAPDGYVRVSGSGSATVNVTDSLDIDISGSGDVLYLGDPDVSEDISGSGSVRQRS